VTKAFARACRALEQAAAAPPRRARRLERIAERSFAKARQRSIEASRSALSPACVEALARQLG
jgi:hypothetical protein